MDRQAGDGVSLGAWIPPADRKLLLVTDGSKPVAEISDDSRGVGWAQVTADNLQAAVDVDPSVQLVIAPVEFFAGPELLREIDWRVAAGRRLRVLLIVGPDQIDLVGASLGCPWVDYACGSEGSPELHRRLEEARQAFAAPSHPTLTELGEEAARIAHALSKLAAQLPLATHVTINAELDPASIRRLIRLRRMRDGFFPPELFADPAWDILLDLTAARLEGVAVSASSLCIAAAVPTTTGLRWIKGMVERGLLVREPDPVDGRRVLIGLSDATFQRMIECLAALRREGAVV